MKIRSKRVWIGGSFHPATLETEGKTIVKILPYDDCEPDKDYENRRIVPGFIDIHTHGAYGFNTNSDDEDGLKEWKRKLPSEGVTTFLATTVTAPKEEIMKGLRNVVKVAKQECDGADLLGVHLEGPYIDKKYHGAQPIETVVKPNLEEFKEYIETSNGMIRVVTIAPEHDEDHKLIRYCAQNGIVASLGHSCASYDQVWLAAANGARSVTHTFNGMSSLSHRNNGLAGAAMHIDSLYTELICDCNHVAPEIINLLFRTKGKEKVVMISDSVMCKGSPVGQTCSFSELDVIIYPDGSARLVSDGTFAGSTMRMNEGLKNLIEIAQVPFEAALNSCTANPAALLKEDNHIGSLSTGHDADIVVLEDDYSVFETYCKGKIVFTKE